MQTITAHSKYLISVLLSVVLVFSFYGDNVNGNILGQYTYNTPIMQPVGSIWNSIRAEFKLDHQVQSARVQAEIRKILADKEKLYKILRSSAPYIYFIHKETQARRLPAEIVLIPMIESEFNPNDHSNKGATGLWQLMPGTATELGVKVKSGYDGRRNLIASTKAALVYLKDLNKNFKGDWYLAISAYNCGAGKMLSAIRRAGNSNFWKLKLPTETKLYLPKLLAIAAIIDNPGKYGVRLPHITNKPYFAELKLTKPVHLKEIARSKGIDIKTLYALNSDYRHHLVVPNRHGIYSILFPIERQTVQV